MYEEDGSRLIQTTYRQAGWHDPAPWWGEDGIRRRVGMRHIPLADLLNALLRTGLTIERFEEPGEFAIPHAFAARATKR